jgi:hypothetical protein
MDYSHSIDMSSNESSTLKMNCKVLDIDKVLARRFCKIPLLFGRKMLSLDHNQGQSISALNRGHILQPCSWMPPAHFRRLMVGIVKDPPKEPSIAGISRELFHRVERHSNL